MSVLGWGIFVLAVAISLSVHEAGHFLTAKAFGMKATRFFIGIGPTVWSMRRGETEYGVKAIPFGAFVKVVGMTSLDEVHPADEPRSMRRQPRWQRAVVMAGGSVMQFVLAFALLAGLALGVGLENDNTAQTRGDRRLRAGQHQGAGPRDLRRARGGLAGRGGRAAGRGPSRGV